MNSAPDDGESNQIKVGQKVVIATNPAVGAEDDLWKAKANLFAQSMAQAYNSVLHTVPSVEQDAMEVKRT